MKEQILVNFETVEYSVRTSVRARQLRVAVHPGGEMVVSAPSWVTLGAIERFLLQKSDWVLRALARLRQFPPVARKNKRLSRAHFLEYREAARRLVSEKLAFFNGHYQFRYRSVSIRNQKTRWGSCSKEGGLNFNYKIVLLPERLADLVIVHELCHLAEFNHSRKFWQLVEQMVPEYRVFRKELKKVRLDS